MPNVFFNPLFSELELRIPEVAWQREIEGVHGYLRKKGQSKFHSAAKIYFSYLTQSTHLFIGRIAR